MSPLKAGGLRLTTASVAPGVQAEIVGQPLLSIPAGATAVPLFIGVFRDPEGALMANDGCIEVQGASDFQRRFGASQSTRLVLKQQEYSDEPQVHVLHTRAWGSLALRLFFDNGGGHCWVLPLHDPADVDELAALAGKVRRQPQITLFVCTEPTAQRQMLYAALDPVLRCVGDGFLIADSVDGREIPGTTAQRTAVYSPVLESVYSWRPADTQVQVEGYGGDAIIPLAGSPPTLEWLKVHDRECYARLAAELDRQLALEQPFVQLFASAAVAGAFCRSDAQRGVWKAPAGMTLDAVRGLCHPEGYEAGQLLSRRINQIRFSAGEGVQVWGARTLEEPDLPTWLQVNVSRLFDAAARDMGRAMQFAVFMANNEMTWHAVQQALHNYLLKLWRDGALLGRSPEQAFYVHIGRGLTMSDEDIAAGRLIVHVGMAALRPLEFIEVVFSQLLTRG